MTKLIQILAPTLAKDDLVESICDKNDQQTRIS